MKKLYPIDWRRVHPDNMTTATDQYYTGLANKILNVIQESGIEDSFPDDNSVRDAAIRMSAWFEDLCSGLGFWRVFNETCQKRHGNPVPFYDTKDYVSGEPNMQDVQLLLWDILQSWNPDQIINPENPGILWTASKITKIFDKEYEYAPETDEMVAYLRRSELGADYWATRQAVEWFSLSGYLSLRGMQMFSETQANLNDRNASPIIAYAATQHHIFTNRHNLLSLTAAEWLSYASGNPFSIDTSHLSYRYYTVEDSTDSSLMLRDMASNDCLTVEADSFNAAWLKENSKRKGLVLYCEFVEFNGRYYQCGAMVTDPDEGEMKKGIEKIRQDDQAKSLFKENEEFFYKASHGEPIVFMKGIDAVVDFHEKGIGWVFPDEQRKQMEEVIANQAEDGMVALMATPDNGLLTITFGIPSIKASNNPYYDAEYAREHAHNLLINPDIIDYSAACIMLEKGYLPDAAFGSLLGHEYGCKLMQDNAQFVLDYMFSEHQ